MNVEQASWPITEDLSLVRRRVHAFAADAGLCGQRLDDLVLAVNEAVGNVLEHGGGTGTVTVRADEQGVWVDVLDTAADLRAGHLRRRVDGPPPLGGRGFGLWLVQHVCDEVDIDHPGGNARLRVLMRHRPATDSERVRKEHERHRARTGDFLL